MFLAYPYTDLYNLNLDWMIKAIKEVQEVIENLGSVVNTFNEREGNVVLMSEDVNSLEIDSVVTLPEGSFDTITEAQKTAYYEAGKRIIVALNTFGDYSKLGFLFKAGSSVGMAEYVPTQAEYAVLSFNGRTGQVTLTDTDVNNLQIQPVLQLNGVDVSSLSTAQKLQYFDAGIRFVHCVPIQGGTLTTQKLYTLNVNESGGTRIPILVVYDPLQGQGLVKAVNNESPNNQGQLYLWADGITMANDDTDTVYDRIRDLESAAVTSVNGETPTQGAVVLTGGDIAVASDDDTTIDEFASDVYSELEDRVKSVNGVVPTSGAVTVYGTDVTMSSSDAITIKAAIDSCEKKVVDGVTYTRGHITVEDTAQNLAILSAVFDFVWPLISANGEQIFDFIVNSTNQTSPLKHIRGYKSGTNGFMIGTTNTPLFPTPIYAQVSANTITLNTPTPESFLAKYVPGSTALEAYEVGDYVMWRNGVGVVNTTMVVGDSMTGSKVTRINDGLFNQFKQTSLDLASLIDTNYVTVNGSGEKLIVGKFGPVKIITGIFTVVTEPPTSGGSPFLTLPAEYRPIIDTVRTNIQAANNRELIIKLNITTAGNTQLFSYTNTTFTSGQFRLSLMYM